VTTGLDEVASLDESLAGQKRLATGVETVRFPRTALASAVTSEPTFNELVRAVYRWYWEDLREDRRFLNFHVPPQQVQTVSNFESLLQGLRHGVSHSSVRHEAHRREWLAKFGTDGPKTSDGWILCGNEFTRLLSQELNALVEAAHKVAMRPALRIAWRQWDIDTPEAMITIVFMDLGMTPKGNQFDYQVRQFSSDPRLRQVKDTAGRLASAEARVCGAYLGVLPVPYQEVLSELNLVGHRNARSALLIAHVLVDLHELKGQELVDSTAAVWSSVAALH